MSLDQTANFLRATLSSAISSGDTTIDLSDSGQLVDPSNGEYNLVVWDPSSYPRPGQDPAVEIVRATALDSGTNTLTVNRGQEGTSAADHPVDAVLQLSPTAKMFSDIDSKTSQLSDDGQSFSGQSVDVDKITNTSGILDSQVPLNYQSPIIEDWEQQSLEYYSNQTDGYVFDTTTTLQGSVSLRPDSNGSYYIFSPFRMLRGYRYRMYHYHDSHADQDNQIAELYYSKEQDVNARETDSYLFISAIDNGFGDTGLIQREDDGAGTSLAKSTNTPPTDEWLVTEIDFEFDSITMRMLTLDGTQVFEISADDATHQFTGWMQLRVLSEESDSGNYSYASVIQRRPL
jgi:hypothetical protein